MIDTILKFLRLRNKAIGCTLIHYDTRGCMADDWREQWRGTIESITTMLAYDGSEKGRMIRAYSAKTDGGITFRIPMDNCLAGTKEMQARTDNPDETLEGKYVSLS